MARKDFWHIEQVPYGGWDGCWRMSNGLVELVATAEVGPRILRFALAGGENRFKTWPEQLGQRGGKKWNVYGGHRLWNAPEQAHITAQPDNEPLGVTVAGDSLVLTQVPEAKTGIQKEIELRMLPGEPGVRVAHRLRNKGKKPMLLAPWALSVMSPGGTAILPLPERGPHPKFLSPTSSLVLWPYTDLSDPRWGFAPGHLMLRTDLKRGAQKAGLATDQGWCAYANAGQLFIKRTAFFSAGQYPDRGCTHQLFTYGGMLEVETLSPLALVAPGEAVEHVETWWLFAGPKAVKTEADITKLILPKVAKTYAA